MPAGGGFGDHDRGVGERAVLRLVMVCTTEERFWPIST